MHGFFDTVAWLLVSWYATIPSFWLIIHPFSDFWRRVRSPYRIILPLWLLMIAAAAFATRPWRHVHLYDTPYSWTLFVPFAACAIFFYRGSRSHISGPQVMGRPEVEAAKHEQKLVTTGMHGRVRHPLYVGHMLMMLGWSVGSGLVVCYALTAFAILTGAIMLPLEEKELERRFGEAYQEYKKNVPMLIPRARHGTGEEGRT
jgi:protein-S-isoprenylcysteine O-methyltransferase Ste14